MAVVEHYHSSHRQCSLPLIFSQTCTWQLFLLHVVPKTSALWHPGGRGRRPRVYVKTGTDEHWLPCGTVSFPTMLHLGPAHRPGFGNPGVVFCNFWFMLFPKQCAAVQMALLLCSCGRKNKWGRKAPLWWQAHLGVWVYGCIPKE